MRKKLTLKAHTIRTLALQHISGAQAGSLTCTAAPKSFCPGYGCSAFQTTCA